MEQVTPGHAPKLPPSGKTGFIRPDTKGEILDFSKLELSEKYPTGWLVVDTIDVSRFRPEEVEQIIIFNESKGRRCSIKRRPARARITAEEITSTVLLKLFTDMHTVKEG